MILRVAVTAAFFAWKDRRKSDMKIYWSDDRITIREMLPGDAEIIFDTYSSYGWEPKMETFQRYYEEQRSGKRCVFIAEHLGRVSGICTLVLNSEEGPWAGKGCPEIEDLTVFYDVHNRGIGSRLLDIAEAEAAKSSDMVYLAVGLHFGYGPAQRMYAKRGYIPDGSGVWYKGRQLEQYAPCVNDDELLLYLAKDLSGMRRK